MKFELICKAVPERSRLKEHAWYRLYVKGFDRPFGVLDRKTFDGPFFYKDRVRIPNTVGDFLPDRENLGTDLRIALAKVRAAHELRQNTLGTAGLMGGDDGGV